MTNETGLLRDLNLKTGDWVSGKGYNVEYTCCMDEFGELCISPHNNLRATIQVSESTGIYTVTYRAPRTIGTLKEIGAKVGDVVERPFGRFTVSEDDLEQCKSNDYTIISRADTQSPVRTVTKKEIVPGVYGVLTVRKIVDGDVGITVDAWCDPSELDTLIQHLQDIREAM